jgi:hypothetical protein
MYSCIKCFSSSSLLCLVGAFAIIFHAQEVTYCLNNNRSEKSVCWELFLTTPLVYDTHRFYLLTSPSIIGGAPSVPCKICLSFPLLTDRCPHQAPSTGAGPWLCCSGHQGRCSAVQPQRCLHKEGAHRVCPESLREGDHADLHRLQD